MKIAKLLAVAGLIGAASLSAHAGIRFGVSIGLPLPAVVVAAPAPVIVAAPVVVAPPAVVIGAACPGVGYAWAPGYWSVNTYGRAWVPGCWRYHAVTVGFGHGYAHGYGYGYGHGYGWHR